MPKYIIEREIPGAGAMSPKELHGVACTSNAVLDELQGPYHWIQTFVTDNKMYCVHIAPDEDTVREHARRGGFPVDRIEVVQSIIDATTGEKTPTPA